MSGRQETVPVRSHTNQGVPEILLCMCQFHPSRVAWGNANSDERRQQAGSIVFDTWLALNVYIV